ncbi:MAG: TraB/GumN family protein, partial [Flavobacteriaceae bacterium]|nr:TraB/GumN family protein [Flavobacteriaceae bacterium]
KLEILVTESDGSKLEDPENLKKLQKVSLYMDGKSLKNILDLEVYYELDSVCKQNELDLLRMDKYKPLMVLITLAYQANKKFGVVADGVETHFTKKAVNDSKSLLYLESFEEILNFFDKAGEGNENEFIHYLINNIAEISKGFDEMVRTLKDGSSALIISQIEELTHNYPATYKLLVADRNKNWIPQLDSFLKTPEVEFVLLGALHLHGPDGVLQQMKNLGYKVEQL